MFTLTAAMVVVFFVSGRKHYGWLAGAAVLALIALLSRQLSARIHEVWMKIAQVLGRISSAVLLTAVFFLVLTPMALLRRIFSRQDMFQLKKKEGSYYMMRQHTYSAKDLETGY